VLGVRGYPRNARQTGQSIELVSGDSLSLHWPDYQVPEPPGERRKRLDRRYDLLLKLN
jgi:hypothetical protein